ncbi:MAG: glycosyltransferase family 2 protein [Candidatus Omnitrophica bacterium]|nr:glycosyltransferase family 2 protein [Candidatus Omnitrophota bacterium]
MENRITYSLVVPVYNSSGTLVHLYERIQVVFKKLQETYEIIFVDDASKDDSWKVLEGLHNRDKQVKILQLSRNFGQHNSIMCGFNFANGEYVITLDDDLQNPPEEITKLIKRIKEGYDVVYGTYVKKRHNLIRNFGSRFIQWMYKKVFRLKNNLTSFRIIKSEIVKSIISFDKNYCFIDGLLAWNTTNIGYIEVEHKKREHGRSGYSFLKLLNLSMNMVTNFSIVPLQIASILGFVFSIFGFIMTISIFLKKLIFDISVSGYTSLIIAITFFSGIQLFCLGLIGEYIGRIHLNINEKPQFSIRKKFL